MVAAVPPSSGPVWGRIGRSHGLLGAMRFHAVSPVASDAIAASTHLWIDGVGETEIVSFAPHGRTWLLRVTGVRRVEDAQRLVGADVRPASTRARSPARSDVARRGDLHGDPRADLHADLHANLVDEAPVTHRAPGPWLAEIGHAVMVDGRQIGTVHGILGPALHAVARVATDAGEVLIPLSAPYVSCDGSTVTVEDPPDGLLEPT